MPGMNGGALVKELRASGNMMPALIVTGYAASGEDVPADIPRIAKPFRQADLAARLDELLRRAAAGKRRLRIVDRSA